MDLQDRVALVTGGGSGVGRALALRLAAAGAHVLICGRRSEALAETQAAVGAAGPGTCLTMTLDLAEPAAAHDLVEAARARYGRIDLLINNAGVGHTCPVARFSEADFDQEFAVHCRATFATTKAVWATMASQKSGVIINISSLAAVDPFPGFAVYGAMKAWVNAFTKATAAEGKAVGIRTYAIMLGAVETAMLRGLFPKYPASQALDPAEAADRILDLLRPDHPTPSGEAVIVAKGK